MVVYALILYLRMLAAKPAPIQWCLIIWNCHYFKSNEQRIDLFGGIGLIIQHMEQSQELYLQCALRALGPEWWRWNFIGAGLRNRDWLSADDGLSLWRCSNRGLARRRDPLKLHWAVWESGCGAVHSLFGFFHIPVNAVWAYSTHHSNHHQHCVCGLLLLKEKV